tara:strand:+ start:641 stop:1309 length:669 start_codon:yes stop_codon:yes gene_type:complete
MFCSGFVKLKRSGGEVEAKRAFEELVSGNTRFASGDPSMLRSRFAAMPNMDMQQRPHTVVVGCADSRVPPELIFDQGIGDLFVIRVAGNVVGPTQLGSIEFAVSHFGPRLVVVLGHSDCGAVLATMEQVVSKKRNYSVQLSSIINEIAPAISSLQEVHDEEGTALPVVDAVRSNIRMAIDNIRSVSEILRPMISSGEVVVVGGYYSLKRGVVDFFEGLPEGW